MAVGEIQYNEVLETDTSDTDIESAIDTVAIEPTLCARSLANLLYYREVNDETKRLIEVNGFSLQYLEHGYPQTRGCRSPGCPNVSCTVALKEDRLTTDSGESEHYCAKEHPELIREVKVSAIPLAP